MQTRQIGVSGSQRYRPRRPTEAPISPGDGSWTLDGLPAHLREAAEASLKALGVDAIGLYQFHRPDPKVPYAESVGAVRELLDAGKIRMAGISNASIEQIDIARRVLGDGNLASVQNQSWMLARLPVVIPIPGASRPESVTDSAAAAHLVLSGAELDWLDQA